ncbi:MAG: protein kinase domain-containing protein [Microcoleaceae cyanobacterium]
MSYCINPHCNIPQNPAHHHFCQSCGSSLKLKGRYRVIKRLGKAQASQTLLAVDEDQPTQPRCVIKQFSDLDGVNPNDIDSVAQAESSGALISPQTRKQQLQLLITDWKRASQWANIPELWAAFEQDGCQYLIHEYIAGRNLAEAVAGEETFAEAQVWNLLSDILPTLQSLHTHGLIHGDIKPANIIQQKPVFKQPLRPLNLSSRPPAKHHNPENSASSAPVSTLNTPASEQFVLVDLGIILGATPIDRDSDLEDLEIDPLAPVASLPISWGSAEYASPEQLRGQVQPNSDLYSLGVTCLHTLTQLSPFDLLDTTSEQWVWQDYLKHPVSPRLEAILDRLIDRNPAKRYQSAAEAIRAIHNGLGWRGLPPFSKLKWQLVAGAGAAIAGLFLVLASRLVPSPEFVVYSPEMKERSLHPPTILQPDLFPQGDLQAFPTVRTLMEKPGPVWAIAVSSNGQIVASGNTDGTIDLLDFQTGKVLDTLRGHSHPVSTLAISNDGRILVSGSGDNTIQVWDLQRGRLLKRLDGHQGWIYAVAISPDGRAIASASRDLTVRLWDMQTGQEFRQLQGNAEDVQTLAFAPDNRTLVTGGSNGVVELWDWQMGQLLRSVRAHDTMVWTISISPDGQTLATGSWDHTIKLWNLGQLQSNSLNTVNFSPAPQRVLVGHHDKLHSLRFSPDSQTLASGDFAGTIHLWQMPTGIFMGTLKGHHSWVDVEFDPEGKTLVSGGFDNTIKLWDILPD